MCCYGYFVKKVYLNDYKAKQRASTPKSVYSHFQFKMFGFSLLSGHVSVIENEIKIPEGKQKWFEAMYYVNLYRFVKHQNISF